MTYSLALGMVLLIAWISPSLDFVRVLGKKQADFIHVAKGGMVLYHDSCYVYLPYDQREERLQPIAEHVFKLRKEFRYASVKPGHTDTVMIAGSSDTNGFKVLHTFVPARSAFEIRRMSPSLLGILQELPLSFYRTLVVPMLFTNQKAFAGLILLENSLILLFMISVLFVLRKKQFPMAMTLFCFNFVVLLFSLIGLTTPVLGALVRYRIPGIPFLVIGFALMVDEQKTRLIYGRLKANLFRKGAYLKPGRSNE